MNRLRRAWPPGVRLQLLCWYTVIFAGVLLLAGAISYRYFETALENGVDTSLRVQEQQIAAEVMPGKDTITIHDAIGILSGLDNDDHDHSSSSGHVDIDYGALVRLLDAHGTVLRQTPASEDLRVPPESITQPLHGHSWEGTLTTTNGLEVRLYSKAIMVQGKIFAVVQVGQSLSNVHHVLQRLVLILLAVGGLALILCALSSYWLTGLAFAPIQRLIQTARRIKEGDLRQRVSIPPARDEIRFLAVTLNEMLDSLDQMVSRQRRFVADASHELRTPVAVIRNKTSIALLHPQTIEDYMVILQDVNTETERLGHLLSDLLALSRGDEGRAKFEQEPVRLDLLARATVTQAEWIAEERSIHLSIQVKQPVTIIGDEARFIQVVMNLLDNALYYTRSGGSVQVVVESTPHSARLSVRDTGIGIAAEHLPHIFERFYRADPARDQSSGRSNSGLGLAIVDWIVRIHNGTIAVESTPGKGSCFTLTFPLAPTEAC
jgi:heavy metal sensor kinase